MPTARPDDLLLVGRITRAHGLKGEVVVQLSTNRNERLDSGSALYTDDEILRVVSSRPKDKTFLVLFEGRRSRESVETLQGLEIYAEPVDDPDELWVHDLVGSRVVEVDGTDRGVVAYVEANPASDLLVLDTGALVPVRFVVAHDDEQLTIDVPDGLFDI